MSKTVSKTVRFDPITFLQVSRAASKLGVCTSEYIRDVVITASAHLDTEEPYAWLNSTPSKSASVLRK